MAILTVTQMNRYLSSKIREDKKLHHFLLKGEISNFTAHRSGHYYFSMKDQDGVIKAVMFRTMASRLQFLPKNGMHVIVSASLTVYEAGGVYQLNVIDMQPEGIGDIRQHLEERKEELRKAGVFDKSAKRPLPSIPDTVGVITSATGAALQDILRTLQYRCPIVKVLVFPVFVQGEQAVSSICCAIRTAQNYPCDVLILGRGGGASEDLEAFNTEAVAYAIYDCSIPIISAVGHETDFTIADAAADQRAATPTAAAELAVPDLKHLQEKIKTATRDLQNSYLTCLHRKQQQLAAVNHSLILHSPEHRIQIQEQRLSQLTGRLVQGMQIYCERKISVYTSIHEKLSQLDPLRLLQRGYAAIYHENGAFLTSVHHTQLGDHIRVQMQDGNFTAKVEKIDEL